MIEKLGVTPGPWKHVVAKHNKNIDFDMAKCSPEMLESLIQIKLSMEKTTVKRVFREELDDVTHAIEKATDLSWEEVKKIIGGEKNEHI